jgi:hypothetical protein
MDITPGTFAQLADSREGRMVLIEDDVCGFADELQRIDPALRLRVSEETGLFIVYQTDGPRQHLVTTATELDGRVVARVARIVHETKNGSYDLNAELERYEAEADRQAEHDRMEEQGPIFERLHHAIRKDKDWRGDRAFVAGSSDG